MEIEAETRRSPSLDAEELRRFERLATEWWDERGKLRALHAINPARLKFIVEEVKRWRPDQGRAFRPLEGVKAIDIGCGGGILSEPLTRLGASVTGIDPIEESVGVAKAHAEAIGLSITYRSATAEDLVREGLVFDAVVASEVVEHVADVSSFLKTCRSLCKPGGLLILSTLNRTAKSYGLAIVAAERVLGLVPPGTHDWKKFIKPEELDRALEEAGFRGTTLGGIVFNPLRGAWGLSETDLSVNYMASAEAV
ncbi:MAG: bifunctional 2-polyprenyl-6-hydroxyphenol methylase/3-demethylubiquinol 3-O-methyltransferase UbiG [Rhodomicrobium sp.]